MRNHKPLPHHKTLHQSLPLPLHRTPTRKMDQQARHHAVFADSAFPRCKTRGAMCAQTYMGTI